ncbi:TonB-dependent receptor [Sphingomonas endolithica]|uniref:TonB-dependent receptor n=1 Tax=Sphingomonas endolithica TaxID=2972485 RepID=UPI0021AF420D|nr:TonB-dependent receptor [Sphingomonas sp. ZFBP2030]
MVVTGVRKALETAARKKRNADTVVDSITATDIGAFPDKSVAEALQRVPGVTVIRSAAKDDVMHYSAEPSGVVIRGLQQVRSEFNGRDTFSATSGYGLSWSDISPELMSGVDTYKNQTAEMIEGGIAGTVNLRTRLPFDQAGQVATFNVTQNYGDKSQRATPDLSGIYSNRFDTGLGEFGVLANVAYSKVITNSRGVTLPRMMPFAPGTYVPGETSYIPSGIGVSDTDYDRKRFGISLAGQWKSKDGRLSATAQYNRSQYDTKWTERQLLSYWAWVDPASTNHSTVWTDASLLQPPDAPGLGFNQAGGGTPFTFRDDGLFQTGTITGSRGGWGYGLPNGDPATGYLPGSTDQYGVLPNGLPLFQPCLNSDYSHANQPCRAGAPVDVATRYSHEKRVVQDVAFNLSWQPTDRLSFTADYQRVHATNYNYDITFNLRTYADIALDLTGQYPSVSLLSPSGYNQIGAQPFADPRNYQPASAMDHITDSKGNLDAFRLDGSYAVESPWLSEVRFGGRYANRRQEHKWSLYNWASITSDWGVNPADSAFLTSGRTLNADGSVRFEGYDPGYWETRSYAQNLLGGGVVGTSPLVFMRADILANPAETFRRFSVTGQTDEGGTASSSWNPICSRPDELEDSCFTQGEILSVSERTKSAYAMAKFGGDNANLAGINITGNAGLRWVKLGIRSAGALNYADKFTEGDLNCQPLSPEAIAALQPGQYAISPACLAVGSTEDRAFSSAGSTLSAVKTNHEYWLPSFNLRAGFGNDWFLRFAASRAISKPDIGLLKNFTTVKRSFVPQSDIRVGNPAIILDTAGNPTGLRYGYTAATSNPRLKPISADQFDLSLEKYDGSLGSFSAAAFYKKFHDYIQNGQFSVPITNAGVTRDVIVTGPVNGDGASIYGFEFAFQRYFDFLPQPLDGFGVQANYTRIYNSGVKNANLIVDTTGGDTVARSALAGQIQVERLENLSDHSFNAILFYEKPGFGGRLAYNWRSKYLNSVNDCCLGFPVWNKAEGFLDASLRYAITPNLEFSLQGSNLLNTKIRMMAEVSGPTKEDPGRAVKYLPGGYFEQDRRFQFGVRAKF